MRSNQNSKCDVIVTYCWNRVGYNILSSLSAQGLNVWTADTSKYNICSMSKMCCGSFTYPDPFTDEEGFINTLVNKVEELHPKMLLPTHEEGFIISRYRNRFPENLIIPVDEESKLLTLSNKKKATNLACEAGVPVPQVFTDIYEVKEFPVVFKTVYGNSAKSVFFPKNRSELSALAQQYKNEDVLIEEWIGGGDMSVDCIRYKNFFAASVYRAILTKTSGGGTTTQREIVDIPELVCYAKQFLDKVDYNGVCGLDFRVDLPNEKFAFIEMNARYTGGLATPVAAGFDIPYIHYCLSSGISYNQPCLAKNGVKTKWILGDVITFVGRLLSFKFSKSEMKQICKFKGFDAFDDFRKDDKRAILGEFLYYFVKLIKNGKLNP